MVAKAQREKPSESEVKNAKDIGLSVGDSLRPSAWFAGSGRGSGPKWGSEVRPALLVEAWKKSLFDDKTFTAALQLFLGPWAPRATPVLLSPMPEAVRSSDSQ